MMKTVARGSSLLMTALIASGCGSNARSNASTSTGGGGNSSAGSTAVAGSTSVGGQLAGGTNGGGMGGTVAGGSAGQDQGGASAGAGGSAPLTCPAPPAPNDAYTVNTDGVTFKLNPGLVKVQVCQSDIVRVEYTTAAAIPAVSSLSVNNAWATPSFCVAEVAGTVVITTTRMKAKVDIKTGVVTYTDLADKVVLAEDSKMLTPATVEGVKTNKVQSVFNSPADEALFGLGQHQDSVVNRKGTTRHILNVNTEINIPLLVSNKGYGVLWDNYSTSDFFGGDSNNTKYRYVSEAGDLVDYYFFYGPSIDQVIAGYRTATGAAPMFPKWAYGLFQSKDKYGSQAEILAVKDGYRNNDIPVDVIVQDWDYWSPYAWGSHFMDESRYPDPATLISDLHAANVHTMISIWPLYETVNPQRKTGELDNYNALDGIKALLPSSGTHHFYDTFNADARKLVYQQIYDRLLGKYGWDAIWAEQYRTAGVSRPGQCSLGRHGAGQGRVLHQRLPATAQQGSVRRLALGRPQAKTRLRADAQRVCRAAALRHRVLVRRHQLRFWDVHQAGAGGPELPVVGHAVLDDRHRWLLRTRPGLEPYREQRAFYALVRVWHFLFDLSCPRRWRARALRQPVERHDQGDLAEVRHAAIPTDAVHLFLGLESDGRGLHDPAPLGFRLSRRPCRLQHQGSVHVRSGVLGQIR